MKVEKKGALEVKFQLGIQERSFSPHFFPSNAFEAVPKKKM